jgi:N-acetylmuramoyl-L-alanine amidase
MALAIAGCGHSGGAPTLPAVNANTPYSSINPSYHGAGATPAPRAQRKRKVLPHFSAKPLSGKTVVVDPGHNGGNAAHTSIINALVPAGRGREKPCNTTGTATMKGYPEYAFNLDVALRLRKLLQSEGARVVMTRTNSDGVGPCVNQRAAIGNAAHADAVISIHGDGGPTSGRGFQVIYAPDSGETAPYYASSLKLAHAVQSALVFSRALPPSTYVGHDGYSVRDDLGGLNLSIRPSVLVELGNMNNPIDAGLESTASFRQELAGVLDAGLERFFVAS